MAKATVEKLYESEDFLVVNKPFDMYINSDDESEKNTVTHHIASGDSHLSSSANPIHFIQRLDYATSGVLCIAKKRVAAGNAGRLFEKRVTKKYYLAVVRGHMQHELSDIEYKIGFDPATANTCHKMAALMECGPAACCESRTAHTRLLVLETGYHDGDPVSVVLLKPVTGRRHQLRVHCAAIGHLILGDYTYSNTKDSTPHRMFLHATRLVLPLEKDPLDIITPEPFFQDQRFASKWRPLTLWHKYRQKEDFIAACDIIDKTYVLGVNYQHYISTEINETKPDPDIPDPDAEL